MSELNKMEDRVRVLEEKMAALERRLDRARDEAHPKVNKELTVKEFILSKHPTNDVERTLAIGYFLEKYSGATSFNVDDLARHFQLAKEAMPLNINDKVNLNIKKGHIAEAREKKEKKKAWIITNSGERYVERGFENDVK